MARFIFVTGGVVSSLGKGLAAASLASLLQHHGYKVRIRKLDPYLNVDPGTMSPYEHGEVYVTDDGAETDLDLGHYERFTGVSSKKSDNITSGRVYQDIIKRERKGEYLGGTVQVVPHVTNEIKKFINNDLSGEDFIICEIGGTIGDIESLPFIEAIRQFHYENDTSMSMFIHVTLVPYIASSGELKTKPTQHSVKELRSLGIQPNILLCRADREIPLDQRDKIALFCNVKKNNVIQAINAPTIYEVPINFYNEGLDKRVLEYFSLDVKKSIDLKMWKNVSDSVLNPKGEVNISIVGKYTGLADAYKSLNEALSHGGIYNRVKVKINWIESEDINESNVSKLLSNSNGVLVPGGFGQRGSEGKILAIKFARENNIPYFGICFGMQMAAIEAARNLLNIKDASSSEFGKTKSPVVGLMTEWSKENTVEKRQSNSDLGGTMRLGSYNAIISKGSKAREIYESDTIDERHRHRYEVNSNFCEPLLKKGIIFSGFSPDGLLPEILEIPSHPWFIGVQFHPELKSKPFEPHPLFKSFIGAALEQLNKK
jgi:CTP synthase|tara:strand:- start:3956 stop:5584 length:1629 start_codon:yes stop_codon:yes gene_type:complete